MFSVALVYTDIKYCNRHGMFNVCSKWLRAAFSLKIPWCHPDVSSYVGPWKQLVCSSAMCFPFHCWLVPHWHSAYCCIGYCPPVWVGAGCRSHYVSVKLFCFTWAFFHNIYC